MDMTSLSIHGYQGQPVPNRFFRQDDPARHLVILLPGYGYNCDMPVLYYCESYLLDQQADLLLVDYPYRQDEPYQQAEPAERQQRLLADSSAACAAGLAQRTYQQVTLIGKSLGTRAMAELLVNEPSLHQAKAIWLTPLWRETAVQDCLLAAAHEALVVIGTADPQYDPRLAADIRQRLRGELLVVPGVDHGLEVPGKMTQSITALGAIMAAVERFLPVPQAG